MKEIVIAQPLGITRELLESLASGLKKEGWNLTAYDKVPSGQEELGNASKVLTSLSLPTIL